MLDLAASTDERETHARRFAQAKEACNTVKRYLADPAVPLAVDDHRVIADALRALEQRIAAAS
jgi:hypothetical protein